jgi:hypothetical protein
MFEGRVRTETVIGELLGGRAWAPLSEANLSYCSVLGNVELPRSRYPRSIPPWRGVDYQYFSMIMSPSKEANTYHRRIIPMRWTSILIPIYFPAIE